MSATAPEALCAEVLSHSRLTAGTALAVYKSLATALGTIFQYTSSAVSRANAASNMQPVSEAIEQVSKLSPDTPVSHKNVENFCLGTKFVEIATEEDDHSIITAARNMHVETLQSIRRCLDDPSKCAEKSAKKTNLGLVLGITGGLLLAGTAFYLYSIKTRMR